ncbi:MAG: hypothetical protein WBH44_10705, partial [Proteocatella sp.]
MLNYKDYEIKENTGIGNNDDVEFQDGIENKDITETENNTGPKDGLISEFSEEENESVAGFSMDFDDIDLLRKRNEMNEIENVLKANIFGGYPKKQVLEYINSILQQQSKIEERFKTNLKEVFEEKEDLRKRWEANQQYIAGIETQNAEFYEKMKKTDNFNIDSYQDELKKLQNSLETVLDEKAILENDKNSLSANLADNDKHIKEVESKYKEMTSKLLEMEKTDVNKEREQIYTLETNVIKLTNELEKKDKEIIKYEKQLENYSKDFENLKNSYDSVIVAHDNNKSLLIDSQKALLAKEDIISKNSKRYEKQAEELSSQFHRQLSEVTKNLESAHNMVFERDQVIRSSSSSSQAKLLELENNYQAKLDSMMKNLLEKDEQINRFAKSVEETNHSLKLLENENKSLKRNADSFKSSLNKAIEKLEEYTSLN